MNRFLPLLLFAGLLSPVAAVANTHNTRDICAKYAVKEITYKHLKKNRVMRIFIAYYIGYIRLIDNI